MQVPATKLKSRFGSEVASSMYALMRKIAAENNILKVYDLVLEEDGMSLLLFNSFKMTKKPEDWAISLFEKNYNTGQWESREHLPILDVLPLWPVYNLGNGPVSAIKGFILSRIYKAANWDQMAAPIQGEWGQGYRAVWSECMDHGIAHDMAHEAAVVMADEQWPQLRPLRVAKRAFADKLFGSLGNHKRRRARGFVSHEAVHNGLKGFRAAFFNQFRDPELFRAILSMNHKSMTMSDYVYYSGKRDAVLKIWTERRNLMPLVPYISPDRWGDDELFSLENWTSPEGRVADPAFSVSPTVRISQVVDSRSPLVPFGSQRGFRWLAKSRNSVIKSWVRYRDSRVAEMMAEMNLPKETAALVVAHTVAHLSAALVKLDGFDIPVERHRQQLIWLHRAYAKHWTERRTRIGYRAMIQEMIHGEGVGDLLDFLVAEGFGNGLPARNATWTSLLKRSDEWHATRRVVFNPDFDFNVVEKNEWESLVGPIKADGCNVMPLTDIASVVAEGQGMRHCVGGYVTVCSKDRYRVFSIVEPDGTRSTLGFFLRNGTAEFDQVRGIDNGPVSDRVRRVCEYVISLYIQALRDIADPGREAA